MFRLTKEEKEELFKVRNRIFLERGVPYLIENKFMKSPFSTAWYGKNNLGDYSYEFCRLTNDSKLEKLSAHISKDDLWVKIFLNIFKLTPRPKNLMEFKGCDGINYCLSPNNKQEMRLRSDHAKGLSILSDNKYKLSKSFFHRNFESSMDDLGRVIANDMKNINQFIAIWHSHYKPNLVNWSGKILK
jgi:hypothetical protein